MFSEAYGYRIEAAAFVTAGSYQENREFLADVARENSSSTDSVAGVMQQLSRNNTIASVKRTRGGFKITESQAHPIKLSNIAFIIDRDPINEGQKYFKSNSQIIKIN